MRKHGVWMVKCINNVLDKFDELIELIKNSCLYKKYKLKDH